MTSNDTWAPYSRDDEFWTTYLRGRPQVPDELFKRIRDYHTLNSGTGRLKTVHDVGAGAGVHSARWAPYAEHIILSDPSEQNLCLAKSHLVDKNTGNESKYSFQSTKAEEDANIPDGSVDIFFASVSIHFAGPRIGDAVAAAARQLRKGGTLFVGSYGIPYFYDSDVMGAWLKVMHPLVTALWNSRAGEFREYSREVTRIVADVNCVPIPDSLFKPVQRIKLNFPSPEWSFRAVQVAPCYEKDIQPPGIAHHNIFEHEDDWEFEMDINDIRAHLTTMKALLVADDSDVERAWEKFVESLGNRNVKGVWPAQLILATKL